MPLPLSPYHSSTFVSSDSFLQHKVSLDLSTFQQGSQTFPDGLYHVKKNPIEKVTLFKMKYLKKEVMSILSDRRKVIAATRIQSQSLFD